MKRRKHADHGGGERWLVSYADFITLLFAFFVVMYALAMDNLSKVKIAAESVRQAFGGSDQAQGPPKRESLSPFGEGLDPTGDLRKMKSEFDESASESAAGQSGERMDARMGKQGLVVRLSAPDFFAHGEAVVRPDLHPLLDRIGKVLAQGRRYVRIEGFADASEIRPGPGFASDWELSAARAAWVAKYWIKRFEIDPARVSIAGYGHYRGLPKAPRATDASAWARAQNRRIEVVVLGGQPPAEGAAPQAE